MSTANVKKARLGRVRGVRAFFKICLQSGSQKAVRPAQRVGSAHNQSINRPFLTAYES